MSNYSPPASPSDSGTKYSNIGANDNARQHNGDAYSTGPNNLSKSEAHNNNSRFQDFHFCGTVPAATGADVALGRRKESSDAEIKSLNMRLIQAAAYGQLRTVKYLIREGAQPGRNQIDHEGLTAQHYACAANYVEVATYLFQHHADVNSLSDRYGTPLCLAVFMASDQTVELLLEHGALVWRKGGIFGSAVHSACFQNNGKLLKLLLERDGRQDVRIADVRALQKLQRQNPKYFYDFINDLEETAAVDNPNQAKTEPKQREYVLAYPEGLLQSLHDSFSGVPMHPIIFFAQVSMLSHEGEGKDHGEVMRLLMSMSMKTSVSDPEFDSVLRQACTVAASAGSAKILRVLLDAGADVTKEEGWAALVCLVTFSKVIQRPGYVDCVRFLLPAGAQADHRDRASSTALIIAAQAQNTSIVQMLVDAGVQLNTQESTAVSGHTDVVRVLLDDGAQINHQDETGMTSLMWAAQEGHKDTTQALLDAGAKVNLQDKSGATSLSKTVQKGLRDMVQVLISAHACVDQQDDSGYTPLLHAVAEGHIEVVHVLLKAGADPRHSARRGLTATYLAVRNGHEDIEQALRRYGARTSVKAKMEGLYDRLKSRF
ncbi:hypothetical protein Q7P37_008656 [Cladosporium fusiforme]